MEVKQSDGFDEFNKQIDAAIFSGIKNACRFLQAKIIRSFGSEGGGRKRQTKKRRNVYEPAPPGKFPGVRSGFLRDSIYADFDEKNTTGAVGSIAKHAEWMEFGNQKRNVKPRPWLLRNFNLWQAKCEKLIVAEIEKLIASLPEKPQ